MLAILGHEIADEFRELIEFRRYVRGLVVQISRVAEHPQISFHLAHELPVDLDFKQALLEMKSEVERVETLIEYYRATIPKVEKTLRAREKATGNGHVH